jgi:hypothetical protein
MMRAKTIVTGVLLFFVGVSVAFLVAKEARRGAGAPGETAGVTKVGLPEGERKAGPRTGEGAIDEVIVYYFHGNVRCATCRKIEAYAEEAIRKNFSSEMASGKVRWMAVNVEEPENTHFVGDYQLVTRSLVLVGMEGDLQKKWKNLNKIWQLVSSREEFSDYVVKNTRDFMAGADG